MIKALLARLLPAKNHFHGGLHITPPRHKSMSTGTPSREAALSAEYAISLRQQRRLGVLTEETLATRLRPHLHFPEGL